VGRRQLIFDREIDDRDDAADFRLSDPRDEFIERSLADDEDLDGEGEGQPRCQRRGDGRRIVVRRPRFGRR
jgi:hypothetical protein